MRRHQPDDGLERGRFAGAVAPHQGDDLAARHLQRHVEQDLRLAIGGVEAFDFEDGAIAHRRTHPAAWRRSRAGAGAAAEIHLAHAGVAAHRLRPAGGDDLAAHQHDDVVGMREHGVHVVLGEEHAEPALAGDADD